MKWRLLSVLLLLLLVSSSLFGQEYTITEKQLTQLEKNSTEQKMQIQMLNEQLLKQRLEWENYQKDSGNKMKSLESLLIESQKQLEISQNETKAAKKSLKKLENKNVLIDVGVGAVCFAIGFAIGRLNK